MVDAAADDPGVHDHDVDDVRRQQKKLRMAREYVTQTEVERNRLKIFPVLAVTTWPIGLFWHWLWCIAIVLSWLTFFAVGSYLSFFHRRNARGRVDDLVQQLRAQGISTDDTPNSLDA